MSYDGWPTCSLYTQQPPRPQPEPQPYQPPSQPQPHPEHLPHSQEAPTPRHSHAAHQPPSHPHRGPSDNEINQQNEHYRSLRARANDAYEQMGRCFEESHAAYAAHDGARAKELSEQGKEHKAEMERLNAEAAEWIYKANNLDSKPGEVDLHGLYVKEAITYTDRVIQDARERGDSKVHLIVGKGLHSKDGKAKLKPAIEELVEKHGLIVEIDPYNEGVLIVNLGGRPSGEGHVIPPEEIVRQLSRD
ncbi:hypothetical protein CERSUDRAFT_85301 [Gelatoporia subvermispora B]|uniref:Smr domain-containing protein n=1 Tax=Ceriporiopsis subvermispora (strain B) TaxID=914234 RepID=M2PGW7_CERS8|nr:hypothetical protein CERSUDRAFT_85301 [Gelatoporia subvermispora B]